MRGIPKQRYPPLVPSRNPIHVQQRPDIKGTDVDHLQKSPNGGLKAAVHTKEDVLGYASTPP